jgi:Xaa-Pro aminopeptidase
MIPSENNLALLRASMKSANIDAYIIPTSDPHLGEYIPDHWKIIAWLTGFTGSAATVIVTETFAGLWTDSRYFVQAENQLKDSGFIRMKALLPSRDDYFSWIADNLNPESSIGLDGRIFAIGTLRKLQSATDKKNILIQTEIDLISELWTDRPALSGSPAFYHPVAFCGKDRVVKITEVRYEMKQQNVDYHLLTSIDDIMWLLNIRGNDIRYSPLLTSFAIVDEEQVLLFADENKIPLKLASEFDNIGIVLLPYEETSGMIETLPPEASILITPGTISAALYNSIPKGMKIKEGISIPTQLKAIKNKTEVENIDKVMIKDGVALTKFFHWVEHNLPLAPMSELSLSEKLTQLRSEQEFYLGPSFSAIVAFNEHGALPHYSATTETNKVIGSDGILLVDSGGQYLDGTTDITRTIVLGGPTKQQKKDFTLVLKGMIGLAIAKFPDRTKGSQLDILARKSLWESGLNYGHGTGHGVGFCLNVHEGPQSISPTANDNIYIKAGMLISDEPAIYREGEYGIRIENLILCYEDEETEFGKFLKFDTVSLCYIDESLIETSLLDNMEIDWLNSYHSEVFEKLSPYLNSEESKWLKSKTRAL